MITGAQAASPGDDAFAWIYHKEWCTDYHPWAIAVLERIFMPHLGPGASVLDLCCGIGAVTKALAARGYYVTGVDRSGPMVDFARLDVPDAFFLEADARGFRMPLAFDGAVCACQSLNRFLDPRELQAIFESVSASLQPGGVFAFDMNLEEIFLTGWDGTCAAVENDCAYFVRGGYDAVERLGRTDIAMFRRDDGEWKRFDTTLLQRCYDPVEVRRMLLEARFGKVQIVDAVRDLGIGGRSAGGRAFFVAFKAARTTRRRAARSSIPVRSRATSEAPRRKATPARRAP